MIIWWWNAVLRLRYPMSHAISQFGIAETAAPVQIIAERPSQLPLALSQFTTRWAPFSMAVRRRFSRGPIF